MKYLGWVITMGFVVSAMAGCGPSTSESASTPVSESARPTVVSEAGVGQTKSGTADSARYSTSVQMGGSSSFRAASQENLKDRNDVRMTAGSDPALCPTEPVEESKPTFWIGVCTEHASDSLLCQLGISCGVVVNQVFPTGPSDRVLEKHDVIFQLNGKPIRCARTLSCSINECGGEPISISVFRNGKVVELTVQPHPIARVGDEIVQFTHVSDVEKLMATIPLSESDLNDPTREIDLIVFRPGFPLEIKGQSRPANTCQGKLELEMSVSFRETADGKLVAIVRQGNKTAEYTNENIDQASPAVQSLMKHVVALGQQLPE